MSLTVSCNLSTVPDLSVLKRLREVSVSRAVDARSRPHISVHIDMFEQLQYLEKLSLYHCDLVTDKSKIQLPSRLEILYIQYCDSSDQSVNDNMIVDNLPISVEKLTLISNELDCDEVFESRTDLSNLQWICADALRIDRVMGLLNCSSNIDELRLRRIHGDCSGLLDEICRHNTLRIVRINSMLMYGISKSLYENGTLEEV